MRAPVWPFFRADVSDFAMVRLLLLLLLLLLLRHAASAGCDVVQVRAAVKAAEAELGPSRYCGAQRRHCRQRMCAPVLICLLAPVLQFMRYTCSAG